MSSTVDIKLIDFYYKEGLRQFHCLNTIPVTKGGLSGKKIIPLIKKKYPDTYIIKYHKLGADSFSFSIHLEPIIYIKVYIK